MRIENGIIPDNYPADMDLPQLFFRVKVYGPRNEQYAQLDCDFDRMEVFDNSGE